MAQQDLRALLKSMQPGLSDGKYYFATVDESCLMNLAGYLQYVVGIFREEEGITFVFSEELQTIVESLSSKKVIGPFALITLKVNSGLLAVGFLAKITDALSKEKIPANVFSGYHHDHLLVPYGKKDAALAVLKKLQKSG